MEKVKYFLMLILLFFMTGCSSYDMSMKIENNKRMFYTVTILSNQYNSTLDNNIDLFKKKYEHYGYVVKEYNQNNKYGMIITKQFDNIDDISYGKRNDEFNLLYLYTDEYNIDTEKKMFNIEKGFGVNRYSANFYVDLSDLGINLDEATVTYSVELPDGTISNNANSVSNDKNILTWNITSLGKTEIDYVFELNSYDVFYYGIAVIFAIFLIFSIINNLFFNNDDNNDIKKNQNNNYVDKKIEKFTNNAIKKNTNNSKMNVSNINNNNKTKTIDKKNEFDKTNLNPEITKVVVPSVEKATLTLNPIDNINSKIQINNNSIDLKAINDLNNNTLNVNNNNNNNNSAFDWDYIPAINTKEKNNIDNMVDNNSKNNDIVNIKPIYNFDSDVNTNVNDINKNDSFSKNNINSSNGDKYVSLQNLSNVSGNTPVIKVNSKSIIVNKEKKDE